ncbi:MAG: gamma-glutamyl-gamma-aminobutyrate hydrolase family protein [Candidatus Acidiferrales bacterium]
MSAETSQKPRIGMPYRTRKEELSGERGKFDRYIQAVRRAGAEPVEISLGLSAEELKKLAETLDAVLLTGSPADVEPSLYHSGRNPKSADADTDRERTDFTLLGHAFAEHKPVLAICYGIQSLNVFLGGSLIQDIPSELPTKIQHPWTGREQGAPEPIHVVRLELGSRLAQLAGASEATVNSSHHQSIREAGRNLRVVAHAPDGVIEGVEWTGDANWVTGVQWHPERMPETDSLAQNVFRDLVAAARRAPVRM